VRKRADPSLEQRQYALLHLVSGFVGKSYRQDVFGRNPAGFNQIGDAVGDDARFAAARSRQNQDRALRVFNGGTLLRI